MNGRRHSVTRRLITWRGSADRSSPMLLADFGWDLHFERAFAAFTDKSGGSSASQAKAGPYEPARVLIEFNHNYRVVIASGERDAVLAGRMKHHATSRADLPAVGDWVVIRRRAEDARGAIVAVLDRRSRFSRRMAGRVTAEQVVAANVDVVFL